MAMRRVTRRAPPRLGKGSPLSPRLPASTRAAELPAPTERTSIIGNSTGRKQAPAHPTRLRAGRSDPSRPGGDRNRPRSRHLRGQPRGPDLHLRHVRARRVPDPAQAHGAHRAEGAERGAGACPRGPRRGRRAGWKGNDPAGGQAPSPGPAAKQLFVLDARCRPAPGGWVGTPSAAASSVRRRTEAGRRPSAARW